MTNHRTVQSSSSPDCLPTLNLCNTWTISELFLAQIIGLTRNIIYIVRLTIAVLLLYLSFLPSSFLNFQSFPSFPFLLLPLYASLFSFIQLPFSSFPYCFLSFLLLLFSSFLPLLFSFFHSFLPASCPSLSFTQSFLTLSSLPSSYFVHTSICFFGPLSPSLFPFITPASICVFVDDSISSSIYLWSFADSFVTSARWNRWAAALAISAD